MALSVPIGAGYFAWRFLLTGDNEEMVITCGFDASAAYSGGGNAIANDMSSAWLSAFVAAGMGNQYKFVGTTVRWALAAGPLSVYENIRNVQGTGNWQALPQNCAALVKKTTAVAGRRGKGRMYVPMAVLDESEVDSRGVIAAGSVTAIQTKLNTLYAAVVAAVNPVLLHTYEPPAAAPVFTPITGFSLDTRIATRRLRLRP